MFFIIWEGICAKSTVHSSFFASSIFFFDAVSSTDAPPGVSYWVSSETYSALGDYGGSIGICFAACQLFRFIFLCMLSYKGFFILPNRMVLRGLFSVSQKN